MKSDVVAQERGCLLFVRTVPARPKQWIFFVNSPQFLSSLFMSSTSYRDERQQQFQAISQVPPSVCSSCGG